MPQTDPYKVLGIDKNTDIDTIKKSYRKLASKYHPDKGGDKEKFQEIQDAYESIINPTEPEVNIDDFFGCNVSGNYRWNGKSHSTFMMTISLEDAFNGGTVNFQKGTLSFPAGIRTGTKIRTYNGDFVEFYVKPHAVIKRSCDDLLIEFSINAIEAMAGTTIEFTHLDRKSYRVKVRPGIQQGGLIKMSGFGMTNPEFDTKGDLYLSANITMPADMDEVTIAILKDTKWYSDKIIIDTKV